jgi:hypothetical protein
MHTGNRCAKTLNEEELGRAAACTAKFQKWVSDVEDWVLILAQVPEHNKAAYKGRAGQVEWVRTRIGNKRDGPIKGIKVPPDLSTAGRAIETICVVVAKLLSNKSSVKFKAALRDLMVSQHATTAALKAALDSQQNARLMADLQKLWFWVQNLSEKPPANILQRVQAVSRHIERARLDDRNRAKHAWASSLLEANGSKGHKWTNAPNTYAEMGQSSKGEYSVTSHLDDQFFHFESLWASQDDSCNDEFVDSFATLRKVALANCDVQAWATKLKVKLRNGGLKSILARFKKRTSTGSCNVQLRFLQSLPPPVLDELIDVIVGLATNLSGPLEGNLVWLDLICKKSAGFRTVATFPSLWRILLAAAAEDFRAWDNATAAGFDTAVSARSTAKHVMRKSMDATVAKAQGKAHGLVLWDIASFYESVKPKVLLEAVIDEGVPLLPATLALWGHASARSLRLQGHYKSQPLVPNISLATGCTSSTTLARCILRKPVRASIAASPQLGLVHSHRRLCPGMQRLRTFGGRRLGQRGACFRSVR